MKGVKATEWTSVLTPGDGDPRHGRNGYSNLGCRCDICRTANAEATAERREWFRARAALPVGVKHGTYNAYTNYRCKCSACKKANADYARDYNARRRGGDR